MSASAPLSSDPTPVAGEVRADGLVYLVLPDGASAALVGCDEGLSGDVVVPARASSGPYSYEVAAVGEPDKAPAGASEQDPSSAGLAGDADAAGVFAGSSVESVTLPSTVKAIEPGALSGCPSLKRVLVSSQNETYASFDGMLFSKDQSILLLVPEGKEGSACVPDRTATVPASAFSRCGRLQAVSVGGANEALASRNGMLFTKDTKTLLACPPGAGDAVVVPLGVEAIGPRAFAGCAVASIAALGDVRGIAADAFDEAAKSAVVALPADGRESRKAVWEAAGFSRFADPADPGDTSSPDGEGASPDPDSDQDAGQQAAGLAFTLLDDYTLSVSWAGEGDAPAELAVPATAEVNGASYRVSSVAPAGFEGLASLESVKLPAGVASIGDAAFAGCSKLATVELPDGLQTVGERAFEGTALTEIWLPASVESLGSRALAGCEPLERVVSLGAPETSSDVLAGCSGATVYCPAGSEGSWSMGLPAQGNHLAPYGVELADGPVSLAAGESADLLEGGSVEAPEPVKAEFSYAAKPLSVDERGVATGKSEGATEVAVALTLDGTELARASRSVEVAPGDADVPMVNETAALLPAATLAGTRAASQVNVTAPIAVVFGGSSGYDVSTQVQSLEAPVTFQNNSGVKMRVAGLSCTDKGASSVLEATSGSLASQKLFGLYPGADASQVVDFGFGPDVSVASPAEGSLDVPANGTLDCTYRLNLSAAKVKPSLADGGATVKALANVAYTFAAIVETPGAGTGSTSSAFYLKNNTTGQVYTAAEVKAHADAIAAGDAAARAAYEAFLADESRYECKVKWGDGTTYDVRVIGINHDVKTDGGKAGLTFQFVNLLETSYYMNFKNTNKDGWGASLLRARMNPGTSDTLSNGTDDDAVWNQVPEELQAVIASVDKQYQPDYRSPSTDTSTCSDKLFLASFCELSGAMTPAYNWHAYPWLDTEGYQYEYWSGKGANDLNFAPFRKGRQSAQTEPIRWWERSVHPNYSNNVTFVNTDGHPGYYYEAWSEYGVCPCFCL